MSKNRMTTEELYKRNKKKAKILKTMAPILYWLLIALTIIFVILMFQNSIGNITEILHLLDDSIYTGEEITEHYKMLIEKWGEWEIIGADNAGLVVRYVDIRNAMFSGLMILYAFLAGLSFVLAIVLGKLVFPSLSKYYTANNSEMVDMATLKTAAKIEKESKNKDKKEWF